MNIKVRPVQPTDTKTIWETRNEPMALAVAASQEIIPLTRHIAWFNSKYFSNKNNFCFVAEVDEKVIGYCRFDLDQNHYLNSIAISSSMHGKGIGTLLLRQSIGQLRPLKPILAEIRKHNIASIKIFERCGFIKKSED